MDTSMIVLVPVLVLGVVGLLAFAGCASFGTSASTTPPAEKKPDPPKNGNHQPDVPKVPEAVDAYPNLIKSLGGATGHLRSYWRLAEALASQDAADSEPTQPQPGKYKGAVGLNANGVLRLGSDSNDTAAEFNGTDALVEVAFSPLVNPSGTFSLEAWIRPAAAPAAGGEVVVISSFEPRLGGGFVLSLIGVSATSMKAQIGIGEGGANFKTLQADVPLDGTAVTARDGWHHLVATYGKDAGVNTLRLYVDGGAPQVLAPGAPQLNYLTAQMLNPPGPPFRIGAGPGDAPTKFFTGRIDEVALYDAALDGGVVAAHFTQATKKFK